jgi:uncharacterized damage-inducible protein DinB
MNEKDLFLKYWDKEAPATKKVLSRIPEGDYRPDPKSRTAREIAWLIVREIQSLAEGLEAGKLEWAEVPAPATMKEVLAVFDRSFDDLTRRMHALPESKWTAPLPFFFQGQEVFRDTGVANGWGFLFDLVHHRGQISTYLRAMGAKVPQIYGPSADEPM